MIHVEAYFTVPSTRLLSLLSLIDDNKDYLQNQIIFNLGRIA